MASSVLKSLEEVLRGLECSVCSHHFRKPKILPCGHSLCAVPCLQHLIKCNRVTCPECRSNHAVPKGDGFPTNFVVQRLVEKEEKESTQVELREDSCPLCSKRTRLSECQHCDLNICERCRVTHSHEFRETLNQLAGQVKERASATLSQQSQVLNESTSASKHSLLIAEEVVRMATEKCLAAINAKATSILENIAQIGTRECSLIKQHCKSSEKLCKEASIVCDTIIEALKDSGTFLTVGELDEMKQQLHSHLEVINRCSKKEVAFHKVHIEIGKEDIFLSAYDKFISLKSEVVDHSSPGPCHLPSHCIGSLAGRNLEKASLYCSWKTHAEGEFLYLRSLAVSPFNGDVAVATSSQVLLYDNKGLYKISVGQKKGQPQISSPSGLAFVQNGDLLISVEASPSCAIRRFSAEGDHIQSFDVKNEFSDSINDMAVDPEGFIHLCTFQDYEIHVWNMNGELIKRYEPPDHKVSGYPEMIAINSSGNIGIIVNSYGSGNDGYAVIGLNKQHETVGMVYEPNGYVTGLTITEDDYIIICGGSEHNVRIYTLGGQLMRVFGSKGKNAGQFFEPHGVAVTADVGILVACNNGNVQKF